MENYSNGLQFDTRGPDTKGVEIASLSTGRGGGTNTKRMGEREASRLGRTLFHSNILMNQGDPVVTHSLLAISLEMVQNVCLVAGRCERLCSRRPVTSSAMHYEDSFQWQSRIDLCVSPSTD